MIKVFLILLMLVPAQPKKQVDIAEVRVIKFQEFRKVMKEVKKEIPAISNAIFSCLKDHSFCKSLITHHFKLQTHSTKVVKLIDFFISKNLKQESEASIRGFTHVVKIQYSLSSVGCSKEVASLCFYGALDYAILAQCNIEDNKIMCEDDDDWRKVYAFFGLGCIYGHKTSCKFLTEGEK